mmetsp:Transcript_4173/g.5475  ORF Transcript_4173/g.5475 Transcript_4173/m.5475 type:complete len:156 (+) Transcript_4173:92-559(+)
MKMLLLNLFLSLLLLCHPSRGSEDVTIGSDVWVIPVGGGPLPAQEGTVGHSITFSWVGTHNVYIHPTGDCSEIGAILVSETSPAVYTFQEADLNKTVTFSCEISSHCTLGMIMDVAVSDHEDDTSGDDDTSGAKSPLSSLLAAVGAVSAGLFLYV